MLAHALKLDVAPVEIRRVQNRPYLLVQRCDRLPSAETTANALHQRLHQEDLCQALGVPPETKYQNEGGPDLVQAFDLLRQATRPSAPNVLKLLDFVLFNAFIGNHDAHGKNFSPLYTPKGTVLAPLYDALCTAVYPQLTETMTMKIGSKYTFSGVHARHWEQFAASAGLSPAQVKKRLRELATRLPKLASETLARLQSNGNPDPVLNQIVDLINDRCATTLRRLALAAQTPEGPLPSTPSPS